MCAETIFAVLVTRTDLFLCGLISHDHSITLYHF